VPQISWFVILRRRAEDLLFYPMPPIHPKTLVNPPNHPKNYKTRMNKGPNLFKILCACISSMYVQLNQGQSEAPTSLDRTAKSFVFHILTVKSFRML